MADETDDRQHGTKEQDGFDIIKGCSRAEAIEDGLIIDVTERAREAGIRFPTAVTKAVWHEYVELSEAATKAGNDIGGRLWDILWMVRFARRRPGESTVFYQLYIVTTSIKPSLVTLKANVGPGDEGEPVLTIMKPNED